MKIEPPGKSNPVMASRTIGPVSNLERHLPSDWWRSLFTSLYIKTDGDVVENHENTRKDVDMIIELCGVLPHHEVLDLCCGQGRHSLELAARGFTHITGVDRSQYLVRLARKRAKQRGLKVTFSEGDARRFRIKESSKDCAIIMGNSFGYFDKEEDDITVLKSVLRALKSSGTLLLDLVDGEWMAQNFEKRSWEWIDQAHFVNRERELSADSKRIISREVIVHSDKGVLADQFYAERLYTRSEIKDHLESIGFRDVKCWGNVESNSTRMQDLGMMANRIIITGKAPTKILPIYSHPKTTKVLVILGDPSKPDPVKIEGKFNETDLETVQRMKASLSSLRDFQFSYLDNHTTMLEFLQKSPKPDLILNLCDEGFENDAFKELHIPALLEMLKIPYTGAGPASLALCYNKSFVRTIAEGLEIKTPMEIYYDPSDAAANIPTVFPVILKPNCGDSSIGITKDAIVHNATEFLEYINFLNELMPGKALLVQEYLPGAEYSVGVIGNKGRFEFLPILEVDYSRLPADLPPILSYESKWDPSSPYWTNIKYKKAELDDECVRHLEANSKKLFERLDCQDYARFDFRKNAAGELALLEVNPNPGWCWDGKFNLMADLEGTSYAELLNRILKAAMLRLNLANGSENYASK